jgi:hypothetical protein
VFENRVLRRIFGPKWDEVTGGWRKLHNEEFHDLYSSPSIIRLIKSRMMRDAEHVARRGRTGIHIGYWLENQKERDHYEEQVVDGWIMLRWISEGQDGVLRTGLIWDQRRAVVKMTVELWVA